MKIVNHWTIVLNVIIPATLFFISTSCSTDTAAFEPSATHPSDQRITGGYPENPANIYDAAGQLHNEICEAFLLDSLQWGTTSDIIADVETLANSSLEFQSLKPLLYTSPTAIEIELITGSYNGNCSNAITNSALSTSSKLSLITFVNSVMDQYEQQADLDSIHESIIDYEDLIISDTTISTADSKLILTTTSIARYAFYFAGKHKRKPRDWDWSISWGSLTSGIEGTSQSPAKAIVMAAVCSLIANEGY